MWKHHVVYESRPLSVIITLGGRLYNVPEAIPTIAISLIIMKQCRKVVSQTKIFSSLWSGQNVNGRSMQPPKPLHDVSLHSRSKWTR
jgi:hypothetical protein